MTLLTIAFHAAFRSWFGLSGMEAEVLGALFEARGELVRARELAARSGSEPQSIKVHVHRLRLALDVEAIDCVSTYGYRLTESGLGECRAVLWALGEELRMAS